MTELTLSLLERDSPISNMSEIKRTSTRLINLDTCVSLTPICEKDGKLCILSKIEWGEDRAFKNQGVFVCGPLLPSLNGNNTPYLSLSSIIEEVAEEYIGILLPKDESPHYVITSPNSKKDFGYFVKIPSEDLERVLFSSLLRQDFGIAGYSLLPIQENSGGYSIFPDYFEKRIGHFYPLSDKAILIVQTLRRNSFFVSSL